MSVALSKVHRAGFAVELVQCCSDCGEVLINREGEMALSGGAAIFWTEGALVLKDAYHTELASAAEAQAFRCTGPEARA